jgi:hypothetical protein
VTQALWGVWISALVTAALFSYLLGDSKVFRFTEHLFVGSAAGHAITMGFTNVRDLAWTPLVFKGRITLAIPIALGILLYAGFFKKQNWMGRYPIAVVLGIGTGVTLRGLPSAQILGQIKATLVPLNTPNNLIIVLGVVGTIVYFLFIGKRNRITGPLSQFGRWIMMVTFGASFASAIVGNISRTANAVEAMIKVFVGK